MKKKTILHTKVSGYPVIVREDVSGGFWVTCPSLEGCHSQGETVEETLKNIQEAIALCTEDEPMHQRVEHPKHVVGFDFAGA